VSRTVRDLNHRERTTLRAVAAGRVEMTCSCEPDLFVDGANFCDQTTAHRLAYEGFLKHAESSGIGIRALAVLTAAGVSAIGDVQ
jgi:hypothetical protein